jgi:hypothetical protein
MNVAFQHGRIYGMRVFAGLATLSSEELAADRWM